MDKIDAFFVSACLSGRKVIIAMGMKDEIPSGPMIAFVAGGGAKGKSAGEGAPVGSGLPARPKKNRRNVKALCIVRFLLMGKNLPFEDQGFLLSIIENIYDVCYRDKIKPYMVMCNEDNYQEVLAGVAQEKNDGIIIVGVDLLEEQVRFISRFDFRQKPVVVFGNGMLGTAVSCINLANDEESYMAVRYLYDTGYRAIGYFKSAYSEWGFSQREIGFDRAVRELGLECVVKIPLRSMISGAYLEMKEWLDRNHQPLPRAFFADNDNTALGAMQALQEKGYRIPGDISIIGMDDIVYSAFSSIPLTTIHVSRSQIAKTAVSYMADRPIDDPMRIYCRGKLVIRDSTRRFDPSSEEKFVLR